MAGLRKPVRRKDASKPSTALILFLVFFIILSLGLGVWGYYGYAGQEELRGKTKNEKAAASAGRLGEDYWKYVAQEARLATGDTLEPDEQAAWLNERDEFNKVDGKYKNEKSKAAIEKSIKENRARLEVPDDIKTYNNNFRTKLAELDKELKTAKATLTTTQTELQATNAKFALLDKNQKDAWKKATDGIDKGNKVALEASRARAQEAEKAFNDIKDMQEKLANQSVANQDEIGKKDRAIKKLEIELKAETQEKAERLKANPGGGGGGRQHALMLDINYGKTLWDHALGKITRIDLQSGQVYINIGSASGLKPEATFMIFGANTSGFPEKALKGTLEVIRIIDRSSSVARITSLYDADGKEIALSDATRGRLEREASNALKEGDLLFNLFFGSRVALAGVFDISGYSAGTPADRMRELESFTYQLNRMGVTVDAFLDLNDGQIKGTIVPRTRYLILGAKMSVASKGKDKDKEEGDKENEADPAQHINNQIDAMGKDAAEKGLFIISQRNFESVTGLRRAGGNDEKSLFRPGLPYAAQGGFSPGAGKKTGDDKGGDMKDKEK